MSARPQQEKSGVHNRLVISLAALASLVSWIAGLVVQAVVAHRYIDTVGNPAHEFFWAALVALPLMLIYVTRVIVHGCSKQIHQGKNDQPTLLWVLPFVLFVLAGVASYFDWTWHKTGEWMGVVQAAVVGSLLVVVDFGLEKRAFRGAWKGKETKSNDTDAA